MWINVDDKAKLLWCRGQNRLYSHMTILGVKQASGGSVQECRYLGVLFQHLAIQALLWFQNGRGSRLNGWQLAKMKKSIPDMSLP